MRDQVQRVWDGVLHASLACTGIGAGLFLAILLSASMSGDDFGTSIFLAVGAFSIVFLGAGLVGAIAGIVAGRSAHDRWEGAAAGFVSASVGHFIVLLLTFSAIGVVVGAEGEPDADGAPTWSEFDESLLILVPAGLTGGVVGFAAGPADAPGLGAPRSRGADEDPPAG